MKAGIVQGLPERAVRVSSSDAERDAELRRISSVMYVTATQALCREGH